MRHAGTPDPGDQFDALYADTAARIVAAGGTPLPNETASTETDESQEDTDGRDT